MLKMSKIVVLAAVMAVMLAASAAYAATSEAIDRDSQQALQRLYETNPTAKKLAMKAKAVLIFPNIVKAGFIFGGSFGEGQMLKRDAIEGYYNSISASWGLQAGGQSYGYAVFLMTDRMVQYLNDSQGWEVGVGPTVVVVDEGVAKNLSSSSLKEDAYAFIFGQQGLMAGVSIEGTKISRINKN